MTSSATVFDDYILWQYWATNLSFVDGPNNGPQGYWGFGAGGYPNSYSNQFSSLGWQLNGDSSWNTDDYPGDPPPVSPGGEGYFSFMTPVTAIGQVTVSAIGFKETATGVGLGPVPQTLTASIQPYVPVDVSNYNYQPPVVVNGVVVKNANHPQWDYTYLNYDNGDSYYDGRNLVSQPGIPYTRDFAATHLWQPDPNLVPLTINWAGNGGTVTVTTTSSSTGRLTLWQDPQKNGLF